ncbi:hypothetical protein ACHAWF_015323 [Thalassiosira exigua]
MPHNSIRFPSNQSYKSLMCFLTSWLILPMGEPLRFTTWGIVSGLFWVPGGWAGIYGIRTAGDVNFDFLFHHETTIHPSCLTSFAYAGLAVAVGTWSSMIVLTSFFWGIFVFEEHVKTIFGACCACMTLILGLIGMSLFSQPRAKNADFRDKRIAKKREESSVGEDVEVVRKRIFSSQYLNGVVDIGSTTEMAAISKRGCIKKASSKNQTKQEFSEAQTTNGKASAPNSMPLTSLELESLIEKDKEPVSTTDNKTVALFNGLWGGTNMIPLHFAAHDGYGGPSYVISFACGSMIVTIGIWVLRFLYELYVHDGAIVKAYHALPSFHVRQMWLQGALSGILYSTGNFMCIISVTYLGQGVGYSFTQSSMLISGLWGIYRFKEIEGRDRIFKWLLSASVAVTGILWLSYEHAS